MIVTTLLAASPWQRASCPAAGNRDPGREEKTAGTASGAGGLQGGHVHARVVVAGAAADIGVVARGQRRDDLTIVARAEPGALERGDHAPPHRLRDLEGQVHLTQIVPDAHDHAVPETARPRVVRMHLEGRRRVARRQPAEGGGGPLVRGGRDEDERVAVLERPEVWQPRAVLLVEIARGELDLARGRGGHDVLEEDGTPLPGSA